MSESLTLDAGGRRLTPDLLKRAIAAAPVTPTKIVSHPIQKYLYQRGVHIEFIDGKDDRPDAVEWVVSVDMPADCVHIETPKGRVEIWGLNVD